MSCGIYKLINKVNGKFYLGSAKDIKSRWKRHRWELRHNKHHSEHLQRAWNKYGEENFIFEILENTPVEMLLEREQILLDSLRPYQDDIGYNGSRNASGGDLISYHPSIDAIKEKQRISTTKRWERKTEKEKLDYAEKRKGNKNPNWKGGISSIKFKCPICGNETGTANKNTPSCIKCADKSGKNNPFFGKHHSEETKEKIRKNNLLNGNKFSAQKITIEVDGITYSSFSEAAKALGCVTASIRNRLNNPSKFPNYRLVTQP